MKTSRPQDDAWTCRGWRTGTIPCSAVELRLHELAFTGMRACDSQRHSYLWQAKAVGASRKDVGVALALRGWDTADTSTPFHGGKEEKKRRRAGPDTRRDVFVFCISIRAPDSRYLCVLLLLRSIFFLIWDSKQHSHFTFQLFFVMCFNVDAIPAQVVLCDK